MPKLRGGHQGVLSNRGAIEGFRSAKKIPRDAKKTRRSPIDVDPSQMQLGPSNGMCSNLLESGNVLVPEHAHQLDVSNASLADFDASHIAEGCP